MDEIDVETIAPLAALIMSAILLAIPLKKAIHDNKEEEKRYNNLPLTSGIVVEKIKLNTESNIFLIDTDDNKATIEKTMTIINNSIEDAAIAEVIKEGSQIKFKDRYENTNKLSSNDIYQIDDIIVNQKQR